MAKEYSVMRFRNGKNIVELCLERKIRKNGYAGLVFSKLFGETIGIFVDENHLDERCIRGGYITARKDGTDPCIILDGATFNGIKRGEATARFLLMHEIGHYCCGHLADPPLLEDELSKRKACLAENNVSSEEVEADCFAAEYLGAVCARWALQEAMEQRMTRDVFFGVAMEPDSQMVRREYQLRIEPVNERFGLSEEDE